MRAGVAQQRGGTLAEGAGLREVGGRRLRMDPHQRSVAFGVAPGRIDAAWGDPEGNTALMKVHALAAAGDFAQAEALGEHAAALLRAGGAH